LGGYILEKDPFSKSKTGHASHHTGGIPVLVSKLHTLSGYRNAPKFGNDVGITAWIDVTTGSPTNGIQWTRLGLTHTDLARGSQYPLRSFLIDGISHSSENLDHGQTLVRSRVKIYQTFFESAHRGNVRPTEPAGNQAPLFTSTDQKPDGLVRYFTSYSRVRVRTLDLEEGLFVTTTVWLNEPKGNRAPSLTSTPITVDLGADRADC